jgi:methyltransferase
MREVAYAIVGLVALQRLAEVIYAERNTRALFRRGAVEAGRSHYPLIVAVHIAWLAAIVAMLPDPVEIRWWLLAAFAVLQGLRLWVLASLGPYWTTRIVTLPGAPLVRSGPYRFMRHPNYAVVAGEIAILPLVFGEVWIAALFTLLNAAVLRLRIREENTTLRERRAAGSGTKAAGT